MVRPHFLALHFMTKKSPETISTILYAVLILLALGCIFFWFSSSREFDSMIFLSALTVGVLAQTVDGALGMAYGVTATTFLLSSGVSPALASGSVHIAETFTTGASGLSHFRLGNFDKKLFKALIIPGIIGGVTGAFLLTGIDGNVVRPWISGYLLIMGCYIFLKAFKKVFFFNAKVKNKKVMPLALFGGFVDSVGGGGWGPVVTTTLISSGHEPKKTIGSVNAAEFFVTLSTGFSFALLIGVSNWEIIAGLILGGLFAAPIAAKITAKLPVKFLLVFVGTLIILTSAFNLYNSLN